MKLPSALPTLSQDKVTLRGPAPADTDRLLEIYNQPDVLESLHRSTALSTEQMAMLPLVAKQWAAKGERYSFVIEDAATGQVVGMVELHDIDVRFRQAQLTVLIDRARIERMALPLPP